MHKCNLCVHWMLLCYMGRIHYEYYVVFITNTTTQMSRGYDNHNSENAIAQDDSGFFRWVLLPNGVWPNHPCFAASTVALIAALRAEGIRCSTSASLRRCFMEGMACPCSHSLTV